MIDYTLPLDQLPDPLPIEPLCGRPFDVSITPPGSKSITCRAYVLAALAQGTSKIIRPLRADDTDTLLNALCTLGAQAIWEGEDVFITGVDGRFPHGGDLYMGEGGAPTRFMIACACLAAEPVTIDASARMRERPIAEGVAMLRALGAQIEYVEEEGRLPVRVVPSPNFRGGTLTVGKTASSQFISAVMLIAPWVENGLDLRFRDEIVSEAYVRMTADLMGEWGCDIRCPRGNLSRRAISIKNAPPNHYEYHTEADASSAAYWFEAGVICAGSRMEVYGIAPDSKQPDIQMLNAIEKLAMIVRGDESGIEVEGTAGLRPCDRIHDEFDFRIMPDAAIAFAMCACVQAYPIRLTGLHTLRHKETDRLAALATELRKVGCEVETGENWIRITPIEGTPALRAGSVPHGSESRGDQHRSESGATFQPGSESRDTFNPVIIDTYNDHRMAMAFAVLGLARPGISIRNPACVAKSYPTFWKDFAKLYESAHSRR
jgi:3-phosphoshikimate 1-carboxyvinyltransferase